MTNRRIVKVCVKDRRGWKEIRRCAHESWKPHTWKNIFHFMKTHMKAKSNKEREKITCVKSNHTEKRSKDDALLLAKGADHTNWCGKYLTDILGTIKKKGDRSLPTLKADLLTLYIKWKGQNRAYIVFNEVVHVLAMEAENNVVIEKNVELDGNDKEDNDNEENDVVLTENV